MHPMRPCASTSASKKSKTSSLKTPPWPINNKSSSKTYIDDLPDVVLIEILSRLPHSRILFQCKYVCKRWSSLISDDELRCRYLWHQSQSLRQNNGTLIFRDLKKKREFFILPELELPMFKSHNFSLRSFLPCFQDAEYEEPVVLGVCNDIVLCCANMYYQRHYYICNPYTKQYVQVPPTRSCHKQVRVGFICDPSYKKEQVDQRQESNSYIPVSDVVDLRFCIVRILLDSYCYAPAYHEIETFSSEKGRWTESLVKNPEGDFGWHNIDCSGGVAYQGMLYWWSRRGWIIRLDPYNNNYDNTACFRRIHVPAAELFSPDVGMLIVKLSHLCVCSRGRLRLYNLAYDFFSPPTLSVWELEDDEGEEWCNVTAGRICLSHVLQKRKLPYNVEWGLEVENSTIHVLAVDPSNEDIVYLQVPDRVVTCNIRERKFEETTMLATPYNEDDVARFGKNVFPFVIPSWPTPLPKLQIR